MTKIEEQKYLTWYYKDKLRRKMKLTSEEFEILQRDEEFYLEIGWFLESFIPVTNELIFNNHET